MSKSNYMENKDLDHRYGGPDYTRPATVYIALSRANPGEDGAGLDEPVGNNYGRVAVTNNGTNFPAASGGVKSNGTEINFAEPSGSWGTCTHFASFDAVSGGNLLDYGALVVPKTIDAGDLVKFEAGSITITED